MSHGGKPYRPDFKRTGSAFIAMAVAAALGSLVVGHTTDTSLSRSHSLTLTFTDFLSDANLSEFCFRVAEMPGVTGVSVRHYDRQSRSASITVYYDRRVVSPATLRVYLQNNRIFWADPHAT